MPEEHDTTITPPPQDQLKRIADRLDDLFREVLKVTVLEEKYKQLRADTDSLMSRMDEVEVQVATWPSPPLSGE